ncbi:MAG: hypothetical protein B7Z35_07905 [Hydrogenophilales bacterium 12-61-10]|nr:MAG: hypothetical protein B7Z35_07905 [Hydrogenophilales bacterium 12-61-10]OYX29834.1 MAG: hypothetical protein B7Z03_07755 [Hydrogenophilales bacterium 32-62-9]
MLSPLIRLLISEPGLLLGHAAGYAAVIRQDASGWPTRLKLRIGWLLVLAASGLLGIALAGVGLMLFAVTGVQHWLLWAVPGLPLVITLVAALKLAQAPPTHPSFARVRTQLCEDIKLFGDELQEPAVRHAEP